MRDPMDELENFTTPGLPMDPLPAAEVRRRGTRMRRRNTALATVGAVAAVAIVATPLALAANRGPDTAPPPVASPGPTVEWKDEIPADVEVRTGMAGDASNPPQDTTEPAVASIEVCGATAFDAAAGTVVARGAAYEEPNSELSISRTLALYPDGASAAAAYDGIADAVSGCTSEGPDGNGDTVTWSQEPFGVDADDSTFFTRSVLAEGDDYPLVVDYYWIVRTGNALAVSQTLGVTPNDSEKAAETTDAEQLAGEMQVFSEEASTITHPEAMLPEGFPVDAGMAPEGATTPASVFTDLTGDALAGLTPCRREAWSIRDDGVVDVLGASWSDGVEGGQFRTVATYAAGQATAAFARISDEVASCDSVTPRDVTAGDEAVAFTDPGATTYVVIRVGDALLLMQAFDADPTDLVERAGETLAALAARNS